MFDVVHFDRISKILVTNASNAIPGAIGANNGGHHAEKNLPLPCGRLRSLLLLPPGLTLP